MKGVIYKQFLQIVFHARIPEKKAVIQGLCINFKSEDARIVIYLVSPRDASIVELEGKVLFFSCLECRKMPFLVHF